MIKNRYPKTEELLLFSALFLVLVVCLFQLVKFNYLPLSPKSVTVTKKEVSPTFPAYDVLTNREIKCGISSCQVVLLKSNKEYWFVKDNQPILNLGTLNTNNGNPDFWYDEQLGSLLVLEQNEPNMVRILSYNTNNTSDKFLVLGSASAPGFNMDGTDTRLLTYYPNSSTVLLYTVAGAQCGDDGVIWTLSGNKARKVQRATEADCGKDDLHLPEYLGFNGDKLFFATIESRDDSEDGISKGFGSIYTVDAVSGKDETVLQSPDLKSLVFNGYVDEAKPTVVFLSGHEDYQFDLTTRKFSKVE